MYRKPFLVFIYVLSDSAFFIAHFIM